MKLKTKPIWQMQKGEEVFENSDRWRLKISEQHSLFKFTQKVVYQVLSLHPYYRILKNTKGDTGPLQLFHCLSDIRQSSTLKDKLKMMRFL